MRFACRSQSTTPSSRRRGFFTVSHPRLSMECMSCLSELTNEVGVTISPILNTHHFLCPEGNDVSICSLLSLSYCVSISYYVSICSLLASRRKDFCRNWTHLWSQWEVTRLFSVILVRSIVHIKSPHAFSSFPTYKALFFCAFPFFLL